MSFAQADRHDTAVISQAQGRVCVQANCTPERALELMRQRAAFTNRTVVEIAVAVNQHRVWFSS